jgi:hypothetical protein
VYAFLISLCKTARLNFLDLITLRMLILGNECIDVMNLLRT